MSRLAVLVVTAVLVTATVPAEPASAGEPEWDERVAPIARAVEKIRHLEFDHPVPVRFLSDVKFEERFAPDLAKLDFAAKSELQRRETALVALQLVPSDFNLEGLFADLKSSGLLGLYDGRQIWLKGAKLDPVVEFVLAHELTHVLQDQNFDSPVPADGLEGQSIAALREGEANWVAKKYVDQLPSSRRGTTRRLVEERFAAGRDESFEAAPEFLGLTAFAPYSYGEEFATAVVSRDGIKGLDALWRKPPHDDAGVLDLLRDPNEERPLIEFQDPETLTGEPWRIGAIGLYYMLVNGVNNVRALDAASQWQSNTTQSFRDGERDCVASAFLTDSTGTDALQALLAEWATYSGGRYTIEDDQAYVERCTDDVAIIPPTAWARRVARKIAQLRSRLVIAGIDEGFNDEKISCVVDSFMAEGVELINQLRPPEPTDVFPPTKLTLYDALDERRDAARAACGVDLDTEAWASGTLGELD